MQLLSLYSCLQIIFESLPVSSSGNLLLWIPLLERWLGFDQVCVPVDFDFFLHIPTFFIVALFIFMNLKASLSDCYKYKGLLARVVLWIIVVDAITTLFFGLFKYVIPPFLPLWLGFLCTALLLFSLKWAGKSHKNKQFLYRDALIIGIAQGCSLLPGISRLASTLVAGIWLGYSWPRACLVSLVIELPLIGAASLKALYSVVTVSEYKELLTGSFIGLVIGASIVSFCLLKIVFAMVKNKTVWKFGWYTLILSIVAKAWCT